jgi:hypothetical protein
MTLHPPTILQAIEYQEKHLANWKKALKPEVFDALDKQVAAANIKALKTAPHIEQYNIVRGTEMDTMVLNIINKL